MPEGQSQLARPVGPREERVSRKRVRLLDAAGHCFANRGFAKTTVEEIARTAGISKGLVYSHFDSKESLLEAVLERAMREWSDVLVQQMRRHADSVCDSLALIHRASVEYARSHPLLASILAQDPLVLLAGRTELLTKALDEWRQRIASLLRRGIAEGEVRADLDVEQSAEAILILNQAFIQLAVRGDGYTAVTAGLMDAAVALQLYGVADRRPVSGLDRAEDG